MTHLRRYTGTLYLYVGLIKGGFMCFVSVSEIGAQGETSEEGENKIKVKS